MARNNRRQKKLTRRAENFLTEAEASLRSSADIFNNPEAQPLNLYNEASAAEERGRFSLDRAAKLINRLEASRAKKLFKQAKDLGKTYQVGSARNIFRADNPDYVHIIPGARFFGQAKYGGGNTIFNELAQPPSISTGGTQQAGSLPAELAPRPTLDMDPLANVGAMFGF